MFYLTLLDNSELTSNVLRAKVFISTNLSESSKILFSSELARFTDEEGLEGGPVGFPHAPDTVNFVDIFLY